MPTTEFPDRGGERNFGEMIEDVALHIGKTNSDAIKARIGASIKNGIRQMNRRHWNFNRETDDKTLSSSIADYPVDTTIRYVHSVKMFNEDGTKLQRPLGYVNYKHWKYASGSESAVGLPRIYTIRNIYRDGAITLYPVPTSAEAGRKFRVDYFKKIPMPSDDSDPIDVPEYAEGPIYWYAIREMQLAISQDADASREAARQQRLEFFMARSADAEFSTDFHIPERM